VLRRHEHGIRHKVKGCGGMEKVPVRTCFFVAPTSSFAFPKLLSIFRCLSRIAFAAAARSIRTPSRASFAAFFAASACAYAGREGQAG
jgi:hypothetical protein